MKQDREAHWLIDNNKYSKVIKWGRVIFSISCARKTGYLYGGKMNLNLYTIYKIYTSYTKINSKWIIGLNIKLEV